MLAGALDDGGELAVLLRRRYSAQVWGEDNA
jgi:hypothetical protein